jgi:hypothetical protein
MVGKSTLALTSLWTSLLRKKTSPIVQKEQTKKSHGKCHQIAAVSPNLTEMLMKTWQEKRGIEKEGKFITTKTHRKLLVSACLRGLHLLYDTRTLTMLKSCFAV